MIQLNLVGSQINPLWTICFRFGFACLNFCSKIDKVLVFASFLRMNFLVVQFLAFFVWQSQESLKCFQFTWKFFVLLAL